MFFSMYKFTLHLLHIVHVFSDTGQLRRDPWKTLILNQFDLSYFAQNLKNMKMKQLSG